jgi:hypothetical protein
MFQLCFSEDHHLFAEAAGTGMRRCEPTSTGGAERHEQTTAEHRCFHIRRRLVEAILERASLTQPELDARQAVERRRNEPVETPWTS